MFLFCASAAALFCVTLVVDGQAGAQCLISTHLRHCWPSFFVAELFERQSLALCPAPVQVKHLNKPALVSVAVLVFERSPFNRVSKKFFHRTPQRVCGLL